MRWLILTIAALFARRHAAKCLSEGYLSEEVDYRTVAYRLEQIR